MADAKPARASPAATAPPPATTDKATAAASPSLSWEDEEASVPDISAVLAKLSLEESKASKKQQQQEDDKDKRPRRRAPAPPPPPPPPATASKANTRQQPKPEPAARAPATPVQRRKPASHQHGQATPSPTLSRYGADLGDIRDVVRDLPPEDVLAHGLYLHGFPNSSSSAIERETLTAPWTAIGALITWLPPHDTCAVAMFYSIATANRALRQVQAPAGVTAQSLKRAPSEVQQQALAAGLAIPPRPKGDTAVPSRLILGALGIRSPSSTRPSIDGAAAEGVRRSSRIREQQEAAAPAKKEGGEGDDGGSWGDG